jgi:hypothetical protein
VTSADRMYSCWFSMKNLILDHVCVVLISLLIWIWEQCLQSLTQQLDFCLSDFPSSVSSFPISDRSFGISFSVLANRRTDWGISDRSFGISLSILANRRTDGAISSELVPDFLLFCLLQCHLSLRSSGRATREAVPCWFRLSAHRRSAEIRSHPYSYSCHDSCFESCSTFPLSFSSLAAVLALRSSLTELLRSRLCFDLAAVSISDWLWIVAGEARPCSWTAESKSLRFYSLDCSPTVVSWTLSPGVWWNDWDEINCSSSRSLLSI